MGPQLKGCGRRNPCIIAVDEDTLQWGRSLRAAEGPYPLPIGKDTGGLQWGRSLRAAEGKHQAVLDRLDDAGFNGAAA